MKSKILILGGSGFLGRNLINKLITENYQITNLSKKPKNNIIKKQIKNINVDLSNYNLLKKKLLNRNYDYVINLSGYVDHKPFNKGGDIIFLDHFLGLYNILRLLNISKIQRFIQIGSCEQYFKTKPPQNELSKRNSSTPYGLAKNLSEDLLKFFNKNFGLKYIALRLFNIYGPFQNNKRLIPYVINSLLNDKKFITTKGNQKKDFLYVDDFVEALLLILKSKSKYVGPLNCGSGVSIKISTIINKLEKMLNKSDLKLDTLKSEKKEENKLADIKKIKKILKWKPKISIDEGLKKTIKFTINEN